MKRLRIIVCAKQVPDPEVPLAAIQIDQEAKTFGVPRHTEVINPFDENAMEAALRIKDDIGAEVTVLSLGKSVSPTIMRKALAVGADNLILIKDIEFGNLESFSVAYVLSKAIQKIGDFDMVLTGRQAGDWDFGFTGVILGQKLGIPTISLARNVMVDNNKVVVHESVQGGYRIVRAAMPVLITVSNEVGELRFPSVKNKLMSARQPVTEWNAQDLGVDVGKLQRLKVNALKASPDMSRQCRLIEGDSPEQIGEKLAEVFYNEIR